MEKSLPLSKRLEIQKKLNDKEYYIIYKDKREKTLGIFPIIGLNGWYDSSSFIAKFNEETSNRFKDEIMGITNNKGLTKILDAYQKQTKVRKHKTTYYNLFKNCTEI